MKNNILYKFATEARRELREKIKHKAFQYGIKEDKILKGEIESSDSIVVNGKTLDKTQKEQRIKLIEKIQTLNEQGSNGFDLLVEEVSYTWFNRLIALRFMEVNKYIKIKVFSSDEGRIPDIVTNALDVNFKNVKLDEDYIKQLKLSGDINTLFKYMVISQCNELHNILPFMFEKISDYTELLFPDGLLDENSFVSKMIDTEYIDEFYWKEVENIGWLYQYYISEKKDEVFKDLKKNKKITKENIPSATQLFTPEWIVKYMVENSLGRLWLEGHPNKELQNSFKYYLEEAKQDQEVEKELEKIRIESKNLSPEDITVLDPSMGSGHILVYAFDVLYQIYEKLGYEEREIPRLILEKNIYGLDIDDRAGQLAYFALMMKARSYHKRFFRDVEKNPINLNVCSIKESNELTNEDINYFANNDESLKSDIEYLVKTFNDAKEYGSIIEVCEVDFEKIEKRLNEIKEDIVDLLKRESKEKILNIVPNIVKQAKIMSKKYDVCVTNPPYMGQKGMDVKLKKYLEKNYKDYKSDLFSVFIKKCSDFCNENSHIGLMTPFVWMFISSYQNLREYLINNKNITTLIQLEYSAFEDATVPICTFTFRNKNINATGEYIRLSDFKGGMNVQKSKTLESINNKVDYRYSKNQNEFKKIDGSPFAYWASEKIFDIFKNSQTLGQIAEPRQGLATADNNRFIRLWHEVNNFKIGFGYDSEQAKISNKKWFPYNKGGAFRKWYGNNEYVVNWENDGFEIRNFEKSVVRNHNYYFKEGITWTAISSSDISLRYFDKGFLFSNGGMAIFEKDREKLYYLLAFMNSNSNKKLLSIINQTLNYNQGDIAKIPILIEDLNQIKNITKENIEISKNDWDSFETSWDFKVHPLIKFKSNNLENSFNNWVYSTENQFNKLKSNEEELNKIFIEIYELQEELTPEVSDKDITISKADREKDIKSFISYGVGCMMGRYSLDEEGLVYAGGDFDTNKYKTFKADVDGILPILDENYFEDDIVSRFIEFVKVTFSEETLNENLDYIAQTLGKKSGESSKDTIRRYFLNDFYKDHVQTYKKRPIYWLVTSGKQKSFNALIYMHRYDKNTLSRIRSDYVHPLQNKLELEKARACEELSLATKASEKNPINKKITNLDKQIDELKKFEEVLHDFADKQIEIDLDDGVVYNYELFKGLLAKI